MHNEMMIAHYQIYDSVTLLERFWDMSLTFAFRSLRFTAPTPTPRRLMFCRAKREQMRVSRELEDNPISWMGFLRVFAVVAQGFG